MQEEKKLFYYLIVVFFIGIIGVYISRNVDIRVLLSSLVIDYRAEITFSDNIKLKEIYTYHVKDDGKYTMLYRYWEVPITYNKDMLEPFIRTEKVYSDNGITYLKDYKDDVFLFGSNDEYLIEKIRSKAYTNEVGIISPNYFKTGDYKLNIDYTVFPPVQTDKEYLHLNLSLASTNHKPYKNVEIYIHDPNKLILELYPHLPDFSVDETDDGYYIKGSSINDIVEIEFLMRKVPISPFEKSYPDVLLKTEDANRSYSLWVKSVKFAKFLIAVLLVFSPVLIYYIYQRYGKEKFFAVPEYISFIPNKKRKPYVVNLLFKGDATTSDTDGLAATLIDMYRRGLVDIQTLGKDNVRIKILSEDTDDNFEKKVLSFLKMYSDSNNVFDTISFKALVDKFTDEEDLEALKDLKRKLEPLIYYKNPLLVYNYLETKGKSIIKSILSFIVIMIIVLVIVFIFSGGTSVYHQDLYPVIVGLGFLALQYLIVVFTPTQFFGRWKKDMYKEYLEWQGFKNFLSDLSKIKGYQPEDIVIWKDWLVYGTALGVADKVIKAMRHLNVNIPEMNIEPSLNNSFHTSYLAIGSAINAVNSSKPGGGGSGGFGVGGGFGGGGAGGR